MNQRLSLIAFLLIGIAACSTSGNSANSNNPLSGVTIQTATPTPTPSPHASATPTAAPSATPVPTATPTQSPTPSPTPVGATPPPPTPTPTPSPSPSPTVDPNVLSDGGFETEGAASMAFTSWSKCSYVHPIANGTPAATPIPANVPTVVTADIISANSPSFTVGSYPGTNSTAAPYATVTPAANSGTYAALVYTGTGAVADTFPPNTATQYSNPGVNGICQSFVVPSSGMLTAYVNEGGYETASTATVIDADQEADIFSGDVSAVAGEQPTISLFNELNTQKTSGYSPSYIEKGPYDLSAMGLTPGTTVTLFFGTYDTDPSRKYGAYMFVDDVAVSGIPLAPMNVRRAPASFRIR